MKNNEEIIFDFPCVTVLFCQICNFNKIVHTLSANNLMRMLNIIYSEFDRVCDTHYVYKVETVAEVYMACAGCPQKVKNHAQLVANAALGMMDVMPKLREKLEASMGALGVEVNEVFDVFTVYSYYDILYVNLLCKLYIYIY